MVTDTTEEVEQLQSLLAISKHSNIHEKPARDFVKSKQLPAVSRSRQYLINLAWNHGWRPEPVISNS